MSSQVSISAQPAPDFREAGGYDAVTPPRVFAGASILQVVFSFAAMLGTCLVGRVFYALRTFAVDPDVWWHIKYGQEILATHHWPTVEQFSFTAAGQQWLSYEWIGDVLLAAVYQMGGLRGLGALLILLGSLFALALYYYATIRCGNPKAGFVAAALVFNLANFCNLRPQMLGYLFLIFTLIILERFRQGKRGGIWLLPPLMLVWINTHGSWIIGLGTIGAYLACGLVDFRVGSVATSKWIAADRNKLISVLALSTLATLVTPYGTRLATYPFLVASKVPISIKNIQEWMPMSFNEISNKIFLVFVLGFLIVQVTLRPKWRLEELGLFLSATVMSFLHMRFLSLFVAFFVPVLVVILARWIPKYERQKEVYALNAAVIVAMLSAMIWYFPSPGAYESAVKRAFPVGAVDYLNAHAVPGPLYNSYYFGGYLIFARGPEHKVFIDGRGEVYESAGVMADYIRLTDFDPGSLEVLQKYNIQSCLLPPGDALATVLAALPDWQKVYSDDTSVLFVRRRSEAQPGQETQTAEIDRVAGAQL
jgi:hypothetical protein